MTPRTKTTKRNIILKNVWQQLATYSANSMRAQRRFHALRFSVLALSVIATFVALLYSMPRFDPFFKRHWMRETLRIIVIATPILMSALQAMSLRFKEGNKYVLFRSSAESLKREIFRYRMKVDLYSPKRTTHEVSRDVKLVRKMQKIGNQLMDTEAAQEHLWEYTGELPPKKSIAAGDDGMSDMTAEQYIEWRLLDQQNYYQRNMRYWTRLARVLQISVHGFSALGSIMAMAGGEVWVVLTTSLVTALVSFQEYRRLNALIAIYNQAAIGLESIRMWWMTLPEKHKKDADNIEKLVDKTEMVLRTEHDDWLQEVREALTELKHNDELVQQGAN